ncbi:MAG: TolC family protein [Elusimicrobia bacterium]|nr:TolC family protein [Elusimicrobiota bacterium]
MTKSILLIAAILLPLSAAAQTASTAPAPGRPLDLAEAYTLALARSEQIAISGESYQEAMAKADELWSHVLPQVSLMGREVFQQVPRGAGTKYILPNTEQGWVTAHQPLFSGLREYLAYRAAKDLGRSADLQLERAKQLLYKDVVRAYLDLLGAQNDIRIRLSLVAITRDRVKDLKEFRKVGRARASELLAAESQLAQNLAQLETSRAVEQVAQFKLAFLTGVDERLALKAVPAPAPVPELAGVLGRARSRPDVESRRSDKDAAELSVKVMSRQRWPTLALDANYYFQRPPSLLSDGKWDATITGSLPLYTGGQIGSQKRQQEARMRAADQALSAALRTAELETKSAHQDLLSSASIVNALDNAARLAEENAKAQAEDYRLGQVTNLDVLGSLNTLQQTRLQLDAARLDAYWSRAQLEVAAGVPGGAL